MESIRRGIISEGEDYCMHVLHSSSELASSSVAYRVDKSREAAALDTQPVKNPRDYVTKLTFSPIFMFSKHPTSCR